MTHEPEPTKNALYAQIVLDHNRNPRNFRPMEDATHRSEGYNPLCGDRFTICVRIEEGRIADVSFQGSGCAISKSSASLMTTALKGKTPAEAESLFAHFHRMLCSGPEMSTPQRSLGELDALASVREYPVRVKCATLPWQAMLSALRGKDISVTTE